jgi:ADP-ribose pyrophosphatase YjhB (NUDIX family)
MFGAAGVLVWNRTTDSVLLQLRAEWSHHGGTWGIPGGA